VSAGVSGTGSVCLVGVNLASWFEECNVTVMGAVLIEWTGGEGVVGVAGQRKQRLGGVGQWLWLGGSFVLAGLYRCMRSRESRIHASR
jgi:hypothetical protein